ncbi:glycosyltransferase [Gramella lutea]|uniref:Glycosyltransferase n=1 Tax=Christiangramia lutea TaxID=1607951 RepID=A0A9X2ABY4_9FLAO|nr:glycosyltransferase [Christiangramia lutea]MCH4823812.1 glycosyltransferase [Christiangramia lutea]
MINFEDFKQLYQKVEVQHYPNSTPEKIVISVLVQTYNHEQFLQQCLDSILTQKTNFNFEIILGEDNSSDNTREICKKYANQYPEKIRLFLHHDENKIKVNSINTGNFNAFYNLFSARGKYIAFCEGDDYWTDDLKLQKQVDFLEKNLSFTLCYHSYQTINKYNQVISSIESLKQPKINISSYELTNTVHHPLLLTMCFRNRLKKVPKEALEVVNVDAFIISLLGQLGKAGYMENIKASFYRKHSKGIWSKKLRVKNLEVKAITYQKLSTYYNRINKPELGDNFSFKASKVQKRILWIYLKNLNISQLVKSIFTYST